MKPRLLFTAALLVLLSCSQPVTYDLVISGGQLIDGSGSPAIRSDIGIKDGRIIKVGDLTGAKSLQLIDATGLVVAPGFIDVHAHIEQLMRLPDAESKVRQGVTTCLGGPDGSGPLPLGRYLDSLEHHFNLGMNVGYLAGHNSIRNSVMGNANRQPSEKEMEDMKALVTQSMKEGAFGLSTGLLYMPGTFSKTDEVIALARVAGSMGGIYTSHLRKEGLGLLDGVKEAMIIGREANIPVVLTHHKAIGKRMWGASKITTAMVDSARKAGIDVMMDQYPYTASSTSLSVLLPSWSLAGSDEDFIKRLNKKQKKDSILAGIRFNIMNDRGGGDLHLIQFSSVPWDSTLNGLTLHDYLVRLGQEPNIDNGVNLVLQMQLKGGASCIYHAMSEDDVERIMRHPFTMHASDGALVKFGEGHPHPRAYGTFPKILGEYVRNKKVLTLEEAIRKMTSLPASRLGLKDRGLLKEGMMADIAVFNPATIADLSSFTDPHHFPAGIEYVVVNGNVTVSSHQMTDARGGQVLRGPAFTAPASGNR